MSETSKNIGPYRILSTLGQGGWESSIAPSIAPRSSCCRETVSFRNEDILRCLRREIRALARIWHPDVIKIPDEGVEDGILWYAVELLG